MNRKMLSLSMLFLSICFYNKNNFISIFLFFINLTYKSWAKFSRIWIALEYLISILFLVFVSFIPRIQEFNTITNVIDKLTTFDLRNQAIKYIHQIHSIESASFIELIIFSNKNKENIDIYKSLSKLSLVHMIVIGGFHINLICFFLKKIPKIGDYLTVIVSFFIAYLNNFSPAILRASLVYFYSLFKHTRSSRYSLSIITMLIIFENSYNNIGLWLSFLAIRGLNISNYFYIKNKCFSSIFATVWVYLYITPIISIFNKETSILGIFISTIFVPIFFIIFAASMFLSWIPDSQILFLFLRHSLMFMAENFAIANILMPITIYKNLWFFLIHYFNLEIIAIFLYYRRERNWENLKLKKFEKI